MFNTGFNEVIICMVIYSAMGWICVTVQKLSYC